MSQVAKNTSKGQELKLQSPVGAKALIFSWPLLATGGDDIVETIRWVIEDWPALRLALEINVLRDFDAGSYPSMRQLCDRFNRAIRQVVALESGTSLRARRISPTASKGLLKHILQQAYNQAVAEPSKLNQYEPFSAGVYGESSFELVAQMVERMQASPNDVFLDLGSGVGQVVLQVAGSTSCKVCYGIERAEVPSRYARTMDISFRAWMKWYGKTFSDYELIQGDFLLPEHRSKIRCASIIYANNFAFGPAIDYQLKQAFAKLRNGTRIFSTKSFCSVNARVTERNRGDLAAIMHVSEMQGSVSWTSKQVSYYLHVIDRSKLKHFNNPEPPRRSRRKQQREKIQHKPEERHEQPEGLQEQPEGLQGQAEGLQQQPRVPGKVDGLLDVYRLQLNQMAEQMQSATFREYVDYLINQEKERKSRLDGTVDQLETQIDGLKKVGTKLLAARLAELDISSATPGALQNGAKEISDQYRTWKARENELQREISSLEQTQKLLLAQRDQEAGTSSMLGQELFATSSHHQMSDGQTSSLALEDFIKDEPESESEET